MKRAVVVATALLVVLVGAVAVWWFGQGTEAPTSGVTAPPVTSPSTTGGPAAAGGPSTTTTTTDAADIVTFTLAEGSTATFTIDEVLRGTPTTVVGRSTIVLGEIRYRADDPDSLRIGTILVNARDFTTDSSNRNRAVRGPILDADTFEFVEFAPTAIEGFEGSGIPFQVVGDLTIRDVTHPITFDVTATMEDETVRGTATATVDRTLWGLDIPSAPGVADVSESVILTLDFVAVPAS